MISHIEQTSIIGWMWAAPLFALEQPTLGAVTVLMIVFAWVERWSREPAP